MFFQFLHIFRIFLACSSVYLSTLRRYSWVWYGKKNWHESSCIKCLNWLSCKLFSSSCGELNNNLYYNNVVSFLLRLWSGIYKREKLVKKKIRRYRGIFFSVSSLIFLQELWTNQHRHINFLILHMERHYQSDYRLKWIDRKPFGFHI